MNRPTGVTILGILAIVGGVFAILGSLFAVAGSLLALFVGAATVGERGSLGLAAVGAAGFVFSIVFLVIGVLYIVFGTGVLRLRGWAWTLGVGLSIVSIASDVLRVLTAHGAWGGAIVSIAISGVILYYLFTPDVKAAFGKSAVGPTMAPLQGQQSYQPPAPQPYAPPAQQPYAPPAQQPYAPPVAPAPPAEQPPQQPPAPPAPPA